MTETVFWLSSAFILYTYVGYPVILALLASWRSRAISRADVIPPVTVIIAARNEEHQIRAKVENTLLQDYPGEALEIIVASDCSTDETDREVLSFASRGVRLVRAPDRRGKEHAQQLAVAAARGTILVFSDVGATLPTGAIRTIARNFADPTVGCVSSVDRLLTADGSLSGESTYLRYEMLLRRLETSVGTVVGLSGSFFAARREVCRAWSTDTPSDFRVLFNAARLGLRGISDSESLAYYRDLTDPTKEFARKTRTVIRGIAALAANPDMLNPFKYRLLSWQLFSHKICRWLVPFFMMTALLGNLLLVPRPGYIGLLALQLFGYGLACSGLISKSLSERRLVIRIPTFLLLANLSILNAWYKYASGHRVLNWTPSNRS